MDQRPIHILTADSPINCFPINDDDMLLEHVDNLSLDGQLNLIYPTKKSHFENHKSNVTILSEIDLIFPIYNT